MSSEPYISVVTMTYSKEQYNDLEECVESLIYQNYENYDINVITETEHNKESIKDAYDRDILNVKKIDNDGGVSVARNEGYRMCNGEIIAYIDSDAIANENWLKEISNSYDNDVLSVGGKAAPNNLSDRRPLYLVDEFLWLVGSTHKGHPKHNSEVRSTFGCNISYRKYVLEELDGFNTDIGKDHGYNLQGEEPELGSRMYERFGRGVHYNSNAIVSHKVDDEQLTLKWLSKRAYLQGITKAYMDNNNNNVELKTEKSYTNSLIRSLKNRMLNVVFKLKYKDIVSIISILYFTLLVLAGFIIGKLKRL